MNDTAITNVIPFRLFMIDSYPEHDHLGELDSRAITTVYNEYFPEIFRYVRYRLDDIALAEDITSEVFFTLIKALKNGRGPDSNLRGWLIGTARHMIIDHFRRDHRHPIQVISDELEFEGDGPHAQAESHEFSHAMHVALVQLTEDQQQVLALRFGEGFSLEETAGLMKKKINAVKALQFRALKALENRIREEK